MKIGIVVVNTTDAENAVKKMILKYQTIQDFNVRERELQRAHHWLKGIQLHSHDKIQLSLDSIIVANINPLQEKKDFLAEKN